MRPPIGCDQRRQHSEGLWDTHWAVRSHQPPGRPGDPARRSTPADPCWIDEPLPFSHNCQPNFNYLTLTAEALLTLDSIFKQNETKLGPILFDILNIAICFIFLNLISLLYLLYITPLHVTKLLPETSNTII